MFLFLLAVIVTATAELSEDCQYVASTKMLTNITKLQNCFENYTIHPDVAEIIMRNLEYIGGVYPYTDIAMNPPSEPAGYFKRINFTEHFEKIKEIVAETNISASKLFKEAMKLINGYHDDHLNLFTFPVIGKYNNLLSGITALLPFEWSATVDGDNRNVFIHSPNPEYLPDNICDMINQLYNGGYKVKNIDNEDPFMFLSKFFGEYSSAKSLQGTLVQARKSLKGGFPILQYPIDNLFDEHVFTFSDPKESQINLTLSFLNDYADGTHTGRNNFDMIDYESPEMQEKFRNVVRNFKPRSVREEHKFITCDAILNTSTPMNYIHIPTFSVETDQEMVLFMQEVVECVALFDSNNAPITIILPNNGGGSLDLMELTQFLLMPTSDFRVLRSMKKTAISKILALDSHYLIGVGFSGDLDTCDRFETEEEAEGYWNKTVIDDFGGGVTHERTEKALKDVKFYLAMVLPYAMTNVRKPTDIIVATDGYCFSACAFFIDNIIRGGAGIVVGYGLTNPGDDLFAAGQCPSSVTVLSSYFPELKNNTAYGIYTRTTTTESYDVSASLKEIIPGDYNIYRVDKHTGYYGDYDPKNTNDTLALLNKTWDIHEEFKTKCNPNNKKLLFVDGNCTSNKSYVVRSGYSCGSNGKWNISVCKVAQCEEGYVVDFENDECVPNPCDLRPIPSSSFNPSSSSAKPASTQSSFSSAHGILPSVLALIAAWIIVLVD